MHYYTIIACFFLGQDDDLGTGEVHYLHILWSVNFVLLRLNHGINLTPSKQLLFYFMIHQRINTDLSN